MAEAKGYQTANGNDFSKSAINSILKNQKYMGT
ncbi:MAG: recombinase family protein [Ruminococcus sp.]